MPSQTAQECFPLTLLTYMSGVLRQDTEPHAAHRLLADLWLVV